jgi:hypothetical protein
MKTHSFFVRPVLLAVVLLFTAMLTSAIAMNEELIGALVKTDQGVALSTEGGEYLILDRDMRGLIGETVVVSGNVERGTMAKTIHVTSVRVLDPKDIIDPPRSASTGNKS